MFIFKGIRLPRVTGIALFPFVLLRDKKPGEVLINHEKIHLRQQIEMLIIFFYIWYVIEWVVHFVQVRNFWEAYGQISFEKEAYACEKDLNYLKNRSFFAFMKWM